MTAKKKITNGVYDNPHRYKNSFTTKTAKFFVHFTGIVIATFLAVAFYFVVLDRSDPVTVHGITVTPERINPGDTIIINYSATIHRKCSGTVIRYFIDSNGIRHQYDIVPTIIRLDEVILTPELFSRELRVPSNIAVGTVRHGVSVTYICNPFQHYFPIRIERDLGTFEVVPPRQPQQHYYERGRRR